MTRSIVVVNKLFEKMRINNRMRKAVNSRGWVKYREHKRVKSCERQGRAPWVRVFDVWTELIF